MAISRISRPTWYWTAGLKCSRATTADSSSTAHMSPSIDPEPVRVRSALSMQRSA